MEPVLTSRMMLDLRMFNTEDARSSTTLSAFSGPQFVVPDTIIGNMTNANTLAYEMSEGTQTSTAAANSHEEESSGKVSEDPEGIQEVWFVNHLGTLPVLMRATSPGFSFVEYFVHESA